MTPSTDHILVRRAGPDPEENSSAVLSTDIFLVLILALFVLATIPHAIGLFRSRSDWRRGYVLYRFKGGSSDGRTIAVRSAAQPTIRTLREKPPTGTALAHVESLATRFHFITAYLRTPIPVFPGYQFGRIFLLLFYFAVLLFAALYRGNVFINNAREGNLVVSQLPFLYILATKNNAIGFLLGLGYERLNYIHRFVGRLVTLAANVHALGFIYRLVNAGLWTTTIQQPFIRWGLVSLVTVDIMFFFSLSPIRQRFHNLFFATHLVGLLVLMFAVCLHQPFAIPYVSIAAAFYGVDRILRIVKSRVPHAYLTALPDLGTTRIRIPALNAGWRAGQYVRIRVLSRGMGWWGWAEVHPFTIASVANGPEEGDGVVLMVKKAGDWTRNVYDIAAGTRGGNGGEETSGGERRVRVLVEGPYGGPGYTVFSTFSAAMLIAGGSGISFVLSATQELLQRAAQDTTNVRAVELVWIVQNPRSLNALLGTFTTLLTQASSLRIRLTIRVYYTRALTPKDGASYPPSESLPEGLILLPGRALISALLGDFVDSTAAILAKTGENPSGKKHGALVAACGPASLGQDARQTISALSADRREAVGGVQLHEEAFHY